MPEALLAMSIKNIAYASFFIQKKNKKINFVFEEIKAPGERFELSNPCEYALYGKLFPGARPTRLGDPGIFANFTRNFDHILL